MLGVCGVLGAGGGGDAHGRKSEASAADGARCATATGDVAVTDQWPRKTPPPPRSRPPVPPANARCGERGAAGRFDERRRRPAHVAGGTCRRAAAGVIRGKRARPTGKMP